MSGPRTQAKPQNQQRPHLIILLLYSYHCCHISCVLDLMAIRLGSISRLYLRNVVKPGFSLANFSSVAPAVAQTVESTSSSGKARHTKEKKVFTAMNVHKALEEVKLASWASFDETVEISVNTGLDPRKPNQSVKGVAKLPHGTGKKTRVAVIATGTDVQAALDAGADVAGMENVLALIQAGDVNFDALIATPEAMPSVGKLGRILGPRGLMPNPKMGTVTKDVGKAVKAAKAGAIQFKVEKKGIIQAGVGKLSFAPDSLLENIRSVMLAIQDAKPEGFKGKYIHTVHVSSTMGPGVPVDLSSIDPSSPRFMLNL